MQSLATEREREKERKKDIQQVNENTDSFMNFVAKFRNSPMTRIAYTEGLKRYLEYCNLPEVQAKLGINIDNVNSNTDFLLFDNDAKKIQDIVQIVAKSFFRRHMDLHKMNASIGVFPLVVSIVLTSAFIHLPFSYAQTNQTQQECLTYEDPILGVSIQYPKGWEAEESPDTLVFRITNESEAPTFSLIWKGMFPGYMETSEEVMKSKMNEVRGEVEKIHSINSSVIIDGKNASKVDYSRNSDSGIVRLNEYFIADRPAETIYSVTFTTKEDKYFKYLPIFDKMVDSFKILN